MKPEPWELFVRGRVYARSEIRAIYGGPLTRDIVTLREAPTIFLFASGSGVRPGHDDRWTDDGLFLFGEANSRYIQRIRHTTRTVNMHAETGKDLYLFRLLNMDMVRFMGMFAYAGWHREPPFLDDPHQAPRSVFHLIPATAPSEPVYGQADPGQEGEERATLPGLVWGIDEVEWLQRRARERWWRFDEAELDEAMAFYRRYRGALVAWVLYRAGGHCECCGQEAPFRDEDGRPYLEIHHILRQSDGGLDEPHRVAAVCPTCHREAHHGVERTALRGKLAEVVRAREDH